MPTTPLPYATPSPFHPPTRALRPAILLLINALTLLAALACLRYPPGSAGSFFPIEIELVLLLFPLTAFYVLLAALHDRQHRLTSLKHRLLNLLLCTTLTLTSVILPFYTYNLISRYHDLCFGPG